MRAVTDPPIRRLRPFYQVGIYYLSKREIILAVLYALIAFLLQVVWEGGSQSVRETKTTSQTTNVSISPTHQGDVFHLNMNSSKNYRAGHFLGPCIQRLTWFSRCSPANKCRLWRLAKEYRHNNCMWCLLGDKFLPFCWFHFYILTETVFWPHTELCTLHREKCTTAGLKRI